MLYEIKDTNFNLYQLLRNHMPELWNRWPVTAEKIAASLPRPWPTKRTAKCVKVALGLKCKGLNPTTVEPTFY